MQSITEIRSLLAERGLRPKHRLGQNFLHDHNQLRRLIATAGVSAGDLVLEVGPGTGTLTEALLDAEAEVIACEIDDDMVSILNDRLGSRITLIHGDCLGRGRTLSVELMDAIDGRAFTLVANLPYQAASPLMSALAMMPSCQGQFVTIQREVADRLLAVPGTKAYGPLGIIIQALAQVTSIATVPASCFWPQPKVVSAMAGITPREHALSDPRLFARFITALFSKRRKQLGTILGREIDWPDGVEPTMRPEVLTVAQLVELSQRATIAGDDRPHA